jgi:S1-C subfamily serine protease
MLGLNIEDTELGVRVAGVSPNGPAAAAGLNVDDTIVAIEGAELAGAEGRSPSELLLAQMASVDPGEHIDLRVLRGGDYLDVEVQARAIEAGQFFYGPRTWNGMFRPQPWRDLELVALTPDLGTYFGTETGLLVLRAPASATLDLRDGDVILDIGGREPLNPEHAARILASFEPGELLRISIMREQRRETLEIRIPTDPPG